MIPAESDRLFTPPPASRSTVGIVDHLWALELSRILGSRATRRKDTTEPCSVCGERIRVVEDEVPRLGSAGTVFVWQVRVPHAHRRECWHAYAERIAAAIATEPTPDIWGDTHA